MVKNRREAQRGAALVEFALIALVLYLILAATIDFGRLMFGAQLVQSAAATATRELALTPLPANPSFDFDDALADPEVQSRIYDRRHLVIDLDVISDLDAHFATLPQLNQMLRPLMVAGPVTVNGVVRNLLRYPGAILQDTTTNDLFVAIPRVIARGPASETIDWLPVVEEIRRDPTDPTTGTFSLASNPGGFVSLRINYPFQATTLSGFVPDPGGPVEPNIDEVIEIGQVTSATPPPGALVVADNGEAGPYAGTFGLGRQFALTAEVRPWRRVVSGQMIMRRETFR